MLLIAGVSKNKDSDVIENFVAFIPDFFINYKVYLKTDYFIQLKLRILDVGLTNMSFFEKSVEIQKKICYTFKAGCEIAFLSDLRF